MADFKRCINILELWAPADSAAVHRPKVGHQDDHQTAINLGGHTGPNTNTESFRDTTRSVDVKNTQR